MSRELTPAQISRALFEADPLNTCCKENDCYDEYDRVAEGVTRRLGNGQDLEVALDLEIRLWFYDGEPFDASAIQPVIRMLRKPQ